VLLVLVAVAIFVLDFVDGSRVMIVISRLFLVVLYDVENGTVKPAVSVKVLQARGCVQNSKYYK